MIAENYELSRELDLWKDLVWQLREDARNMIPDAEDHWIHPAGALYWIEDRLNEMLEECELTLEEPK